MQPTKDDLLQDNWWEFLGYIKNQREDYEKESKGKDYPHDPNEVWFWIWFMKYKYDTYLSEPDTLAIGVATPLPPDYVVNAPGVVNPKSPEQMASEQEQRIRKLARKKTNTEDVFKQ